MKFEIKNRWTGATQFECEMPADIAGASYGVRLGFAVQKALEVGASLVGASLVDASLVGASLVGANLADADLDGASLVGANLTDASLAGASLAGADLDGASLVGASLVGASLTGADLDGASLVDANLVDANLAGANLTGASLVGASLVGAKWRNNITIQRVPLQLYGLDYPVTILDRHMQIGCELHTLAEWRAFDNERIARMDGLRARKFWARHRDALLALAESDGRGVEPVAEEA